MKTIIAGSRSVDNFHLVCKAVEESGFADEITEVVSGGAMGVDKLGERIAKKFGFHLKIFPADWKKYDKAAGMIRNKQMAEYADALIACVYNASPGTSNMIELAKDKGLKVFVYRVKDEEMEKREEKTISGYCDACGQFSADLTVIQSRNIAGLCSCSECLS